MAADIILVVEDNDAMREGIKMILESDGFEVLSAVHGLAALDQMKSVLPDLILSDISMPLMDGYAFLEAVRARAEWVAIPFIFLTARGERQDIFTGKKMGAEDYLVKPVNHQELVTAIRSRLDRSRELLLAQLKQAYQASLIMFSNAIELRDPYTRGHVERVMDYSLAIAVHLKSEVAYQNALRFGSILHDIGKIHISERILHKPGALKKDEWEEMKLHPIIGADLVKNIPFLSPAIPVIRHHHEQWNGNGYPDGLSGKEIPLEARIVSVADSLDAITTYRVYRAAWSPVQAYQEILRCSGSRFDPEIVLAFQEAWPEIQQSLEKK